MSGKAPDPNSAMPPATVSRHAGQGRVGSAPSQGPRPGSLAVDGNAEWLVSQARRSHEKLQ